MGQRIVPFIGYEDAASAIEWLERAFGFREERDQRHEEGGRITHAELRLDGATIYVASPDAYASPRTVRAESEAARRAYDNPWVIDGHFVVVEDVEAHYERARAGGATILSASTPRKTGKATVGCSASGFDATSLARRQLVRGRGRLDR